MTKNYAVKATEENIFVITAFLASQKIELDYLSDTMQINADKGLETWVILSRNPSAMTQKATKMNEMDFFGNWRLHPRSIVKITDLDFFQEIQYV